MQRKELATSNKISYLPSFFFLLVYKRHCHVLFLPGVQLLTNEMQISTFVLLSCAKIEICISLVSSYAISV